MSTESAFPPRLVRDLMTVGVLTCPPETSAKEVARLLLQRDLEGLVVLDIEGHAVGVVTLQDLAKAFAEGKIEDATAEDIMHAGVPQIPPDIPLETAVHLMLDEGHRVYFLMHHAGGVLYPAAMISFKHVIRVIAAHDQADLRDLGIKAERELPVETFIKKRDAARRHGNTSVEE